MSGTEETDYEVLERDRAARLLVLTPDDYLSGVSLYAMVDNWGGWVNRRVERVELMDSVASRRHISIDCALREEFKICAADGQRRFYVPLTLHKKQRVTGFSVRDETGNALPILTQARSAYLGTATLAVAALSMWVERKGSESLEGSIAPDVLADLDYIATEDWRSAMARLKVFADVPTRERAQAEAALRDPWGNPATTRATSPTLMPRSADTKEMSRSWRTALTYNDKERESNAFLDLATDFAQNFLILALVDDDVSPQHRLFKMSFEEQRRVPPPYVLSGLRSALSGHPSKAIASTWRLAVTAVCRPAVTMRKALAWSRRCPEWAIGGVRTGLHTVRRPGPAAKRSVAWLGRAVRNGRTLWRKGMRAIAVKPKVFAIPAPALGRCDCYHLEVVAPEGLQITGAELRPITPPGQDLPPSDQVDRVARSVQRAHLHLAGVNQAQTGEGRIALRPRTWNVLVPACVAGVLAVALLSVIGSSWDRLAEPNQAAALLLALPAGLSFFVARRTEAGLVTSVLRGVRLLAFLMGAYALAGAALVVSGENCEANTGIWLLPNGQFGCAPDYLWWLTAIAFATLVPIALATWRAWDPPLRREINDDEDDFD